MKKTKAKRSRAPEIDPVEREMRELQLEDLRSKVSRERSVREFRTSQLKSQEEQLKKSRLDQCRIQAVCKHRKGGKDKAGILNGVDSNYAIIVHTYPNMETVVECQRCYMEWHPGDTKAKLRTGAVNHTKISYEEAMGWPTDNEPSSGTFFLIPTSDAGLMSEIHRLQAQLAQLQASGVNIDIGVGA